MVRDRHHDDSIQPKRRIMKLIGLPLRKRWLFVLLIVFWSTFTLFWYQTRLELPQSIEPLLYGAEPAEILAKVSNFVEELPSDASIDCSAMTLRDAPFVVRGRVHDWPALQRWTFEWVRDINVTADVLVSPSLDFTFYALKMGKTILEKDGPSALPAVMTEMQTYEAVQRMMISRNHNLHNLFYNKNGGREHYYIRFDLNQEMLNDIDLSQGILQCAKLSRENPRFWMSGRGSVSPMHWDGGYSCLVQIRGKKRMLFYSPIHEKSFGRYPKGHLLWRRSRFNPTNPDYHQFFNAKDIGGTITTLEPGDIVCFPPRWLHYTDCLTHSISLTFRFDPV